MVTWVRLNISLHVHCFVLFPLASKNRNTWSRPSCHQMRLRDSHFPLIGFQVQNVPSHIRCHVLVPEGISGRQSLNVSFSFVSRNTEISGLLRNTYLRPAISGAFPRSRGSSNCVLTYTAISRRNITESESFHREVSANDVKPDMVNLLAPEFYI